MAQQSGRVAKRIQAEVGPRQAVAETLQRNIETLGGKRQQNVTNNTYPTAGVTSFDVLTGDILLATTNNVTSTVVGQTITFNGRIGVRYGFRWPTAGQNITLVEDDYSIYGTVGQHCNDVTFPLAASYPGKRVEFTYPPSGSLIASGGDTVDGYANQTAAYQSDGVSRWFRVWSI